ncbi:sialidase family protein [Actinacidiphila yeochonensis]|uniref:sialidase family protein n=1 Tax=Actinacidiphila yeochonensis TaxID=89050 RepID=UPI0006921C7A|nr:sialidase family protein [Actinacidiphila yeochonensis]
MSFDRRRLLALPLAAGGALLAGRPAWAGTASADGSGTATAEGSETTAPATGTATATATDSSTPAAFEQSVPFTAGEDGYATYRIPAVVRTGAGTLVAFAEARASGSDTGAIVVAAKRSTDGGRSWGPLAVVAGDGTNTQGNPCPVVDPHSGDIILLTCTNAADATESSITSGQVPPADGRRVWVQRGTHDGRVFSAPQEITAQAKQPDWRWYATGPGHAVALTSGPFRGRLVVPANHSVPPSAGSSDTGSEAKYYGGHCLLSDDAGHTWRIGFTDDTPDGVVNANESTAAQLPDGTLYFNARDQGGSAPGTRADARSTDGGAHLLHPYASQPQLAGPAVEGSVLQPSAGPLLFSGPSAPTTRASMAVRASNDGGHTWRTALTLSTAPAGYSDLVQLSPTEVGLLYETGTSSPYEQLTFARIPLSTLTD